MTTGIDLAARPTQQLPLQDSPAAEPTSARARLRSTSRLHTPLVAAFALVASGCITVGKQFRDNGLQVAAYELGCPADKVTLNDLVGKETDESWPRGREPVVAVSGFGKRASYTVYRYYGEWVRREERVEVAE